MTPQGFEPTAELMRRGGRIELLHNIDAATVVAVASGWIGPRLLSDEFIVLRDITATSDDWRYVVDTTDVRFANPLNVIILRRLASLRGLSTYRVVAPRAPVRMVLRILRRLVGADGIDTDLVSALRILEI